MNIQEKNKFFLNTNPKRYWFFADKWFRILEFSVILAILNYFMKKSGDILITILFFVSYIIFLMWFLEFQEYILEKILEIKKLNIKYKIFIDVLIFCVFIFFNILIFYSSGKIVFKG